MSTFRLATPAAADLRAILAASAERWGIARSDRYASLLTATLVAAATDPEGPLTRRERRGIRSLHTRHLRRGSGVAAPVHVVYFRAIDDGIEVVRILHERMVPERHLLRPRAR